MPQARENAAAFRALVGPELEYAATPALAQRGTIGARWRRADGTALVVSGTVERLAGRGALAAIPTAPQGERTVVSLVVALVR